MKRYNSAFDDRERIRYRRAASIKTVYDPRKFSDDIMLDLAKKAAAKGYIDAMRANTPNESYNSNINGINFRIYLDKETGEIRNVHPK